MSDNSDRNRQIAHAILQGEPVSKVSSSCGLSRARCIQILNGYCRNVNRSLYCEICSSIKVKALSLKIIMENADEFMQCNDEQEIISNTFLYRIDQIPNYVINALESWGIHTVEDLLKVDMQKLENVPMLGKKAIKLIGDFVSTFTEGGGS